MRYRDLQDAGYDTPLSAARVLVDRSECSSDEQYQEVLREVADVLVDDQEEADRYYEDRCSEERDEDDDK